MIRRAENMHQLQGSQFVSRMRMIGTLTIRVRDVRTKRVLRVWRKRNTITYAAGDIVRDLLAQRATDAAPAELKLGSMRFGTNDTSPTRGDTNLLNEIASVRRQLTDLTKINGGTGEISLHATMEGTAGNGYTYQEAGLFTNGVTWNADVGGNLQMFTRQVHPAIEKTAAVSLEYDWKLQFTV
jgi:hypothetical protein